MSDINVKSWHDHTAELVLADFDAARAAANTLHALIEEIGRYNDELNGMEVCPNGDDYNALLEIIRLYGEGRGDAARSIQPAKEGDR